MSKFSSGKITAFIAVAGVAVLGAIASPVCAQKVYYGCADQWNDLLKNPGQWNFVRHNADGFYLNFIEMEPKFSDKTQALLNSTAALFTQKNAYFESDMQSDSQSLAFDRRDIDYLQKAGFKVPYTSLNYGWSKERYENLKSYHLLKGQSPRFSFVQQGPWAVNGSILHEGGPVGYTNANYRSWIDQADGVSTDGPLGFWFADQSGMRSGTYSMVNYSHSQGKTAVVMLAPYAAGIAAYDPAKMYLSTSEACVRMLEDNDAEPDIYDIFEYATTIGAVPEQVNGVPVQNSTTSVAYYLIKHLHGDPGTLTLSIQRTGPKIEPSSKEADIPTNAKKGAVYHYLLKVTDKSSWLDYAAVLSAKQTQGEGWDVQYKLGPVDITQSVLGDGYKFYQAYRIMPESSTVVDLYLTRTSRGNPAVLNLLNSLKPHARRDVMDSVILRTKGGL